MRDTPGWVFVQRFWDVHAYYLEAKAISSDEDQRYWAGQYIGFLTAMQMVDRLANAKEHDGGPPMTGAEQDFLEQEEAKFLELQHRMAREKFPSY